MNEEMSRNYVTLEQIFDVLAKRDFDAFGQLVLTQPYLLAEDEKHQLIAAAQAGDRDALNQVVSAKVVFAVSIARQYVQVHEDVHICKLIEYAVRGLIDAIKTYNLADSNEMSFIAFAAPMMRQSIIAGIAASRRKPRTLKITKTITERSTTEPMSAKDQEGIMPNLRLSDFDHISEIRESEKTQRQLKIMMHSDERSTVDYDHIAEILSVSSIYNLKKMSDEKVQENLACLTDREREVIQMLIGYGCASMSVKEVANKLLLTTTRIRQIRDKAIEKIISSNEKTTMTIIEAKLPVTLHLVFDNDPELYSCELVAIENIDTENDTCKLVCEDLMPQTCRLTAPYSSLDAAAIHFETGIHLFLDENEAMKLAESFK